jgi:hypothetical protein
MYTLAPSPSLLLRAAGQLPAAGALLPLPSSAHRSEIFTVILPLAAQDPAPNLPSPSSAFSVLRRRRTGAMLHVYVHGIRSSSGTWHLSYQGQHTAPPTRLPVGLDPTTGRRTGACCMCMYNAHGIRSSSGTWHLSYQGQHTAPPTRLPVGPGLDPTTGNRQHQHIIGDVIGSVIAGRPLLCSALPLPPD